MNGKWKSRIVSPKEVIEVIRNFGAPSTSEIKFQLRTDSKSLRKPLGILLAHNKVFPMAYKGGIVWIEVTARRGRPNPEKLRREAGKGTFRQEARGRRERAVTTPAVRLPDTVNPKPGKRLMVDRKEEW